MKKIILSGALCTLIASGAMIAPQAAFAEETTEVTTQSAMLAQIDQLMKLIAELQKQLNVAKGEIKELMSDLREGAEGDDVLKVQEVLATDPSIFGVKPTGFFGPMTKQALMKFQERYGLEVTGVLDEATREAIKELREDGKIVPGLLTSEAAKDRIKSRLQEKWGDCDFTKPFRASLCEKVKADDSEDDEDSDEDESDDEDEDAVVTRDDARRAVVDAQNELNSFKDDIEDMEDDDATDEEIDAATDVLKEAQASMSVARRALTQGEFDKAFEAAEEVISTLAGDTDEDSDDDSEDSEDEDEDSDDEDEDESEDDSDDSDEDDE